MTTPLPDRETLKSQAKRLRSDMSAKNTPLTHAQALEAIAHQWGYKDWNTLSALATDHAPQKWQVGQSLSGRYLGHPFTGHVKSASSRANGFVALIIRFDAPIDVVKSEGFSALRQQINCVVNSDGVSVQKISDGTPHVEINL